MRPFNLGGVLLALQGHAVGSQVSASALERRGMTPQIGHYDAVGEGFVTASTAAP